ncbi:ABC transporter permease [Guptibacillus algicola]|uniref:ABC transporter permease n=1 Tax=Guptibacillus algicola TaxID=225844 RepID=UPI001CD490C3|nr:ABC transporter permease subunit [Alkalihalobacillus algicola]MCA0985887.1 ABC transporter permease subunit [Alkalihalobacillus algicola]
MRLKEIISGKKRKVIVLITLFIFMLLFILPLFTIVVKSFAADWKWPILFPNELGLDGWVVIFTDPALVKSVITTLKLGIMVVLLNLILAMPAAKALSLYTFKVKFLIEAFLLSPILIPGILLAMGLQYTLIQFGLADRLSGVLLVHLIPTLPYSIRIMRAGYERLGKGLSEQAAVLGSGPLIRFFTVSLPLLIPSIRSLMLLTFVISLGQYALTAIIGGGVVTTLPLLYYPYFSSSNEAVIAGFSLLFALLPLLFVGVAEIALRAVIRVVNRS